MEPTTPTTTNKYEELDNYIYSLIQKNKLKTFSVKDFEKSLSVEQKKELERIYTTTYESLWPFFSYSEKARAPFLRLKDAGKLVKEVNYKLFTLI